LLLVLAVLVGLHGRVVELDFLEQMAQTRQLLV
jgi:hypothetical protein